MENIHVALKLRPLNQKESLSMEEEIWQINEAMNRIDIDSNYLTNIIISNHKQSQKQTFSFDYCFNSNTKNLEIYTKTVKQIILSSLDGINSTIFMYGQTGSGKTYTMLGPENDLNTSANEMITNINGNNNDMGLLLYTFNDLFKIIQQDDSKTYIIKCSYVEIYNDNIYDLLISKEEAFNETITVNEDSNKEFFLKGVNEESINNLEEILEIMKKGENNRHYAETNMNHVSSRSHSIFKLIIKTFSNGFIKKSRKEKNETNNINNVEYLNSINSNKTTVITEACINFVDLAGSEKISNHYVNIKDDEEIIENNIGKENGWNSKVKDRIKEGQFINKSLFFLTQVISLKSENKNNTHIPYRNSPLTKILRSSLGGNSRTLVILCANPTISSYEQTLSTLRFGANAKKIENKIEANILMNNEDETLKIIAKEYEKKIKELEYNKNDYKFKVDQQNILIEKLQIEIKKLKDKIMRKNIRFFDKNNQNPISSISNSNNNFTYLENIGFLFKSSQNITATDLLNNNPKLKSNFQDLLFDFEGKYALEAFKKSKELINIQKNYIAQLEKNCNCIIEHHMYSFENYLYELQKNKTINEELENYKQITQDQKLQILFLKKNSLNQTNLKSFNLYELENRAKNLEIELENIRNEKINRIYIEEINQLKEKLSILYPNSHNIVQEAQQLLEKPTDINNYCTLHTEISDSYLEDEKKELIEEEKKKIIAIFNLDLDKNIQNIKKISFEINNFEPKILAELKPNTKKSLIYINSSINSIQNSEITENNKSAEIIKKIDKKPKRTQKPKSVIPYTGNLIKNNEKPKFTQILNKSEQKKTRKKSINNNISSKTIEKKHNFEFFEKEKLALNEIIEQRARTVQKEQENLIKLQELIEDKKIQNNKNSDGLSQRELNCEKNCDKFNQQESLIYMKKMQDLKESAENIKNLVKNVQTVVTQNMENVPFPKKCQFSDFFSEKDFNASLLDIENDQKTGNNKENINFLEISEKSEIRNDSSINESVLDISKAKKRRSRNERNKNKDPQC